MKNVALTISGNRYEVSLEDDFVDFVNKDLKSSGINFHTDNKPDKLLKAYLSLAKQVMSHENEMELIIKALDNI